MTEISVGQFERSFRLLDQNAYSSPVAPESKAEAVEKALRDAIVHCVLKPGERLSEAGLASEFAFGRGAVRAALARLQAAGFVSSTARSGWRVTSVSAREIREVSAARRQLEPLLCSVSLSQSDRTNLNRFAEMQMALMQRHDLGHNSLSTVRRCERDMLETLVARLNMPIVAGWLNDLWDRSIRLVNFFEAAGSEKLAPTSRWHFVEALLEGRRADALSQLAGANAALEAYLLDRFLQSEAMVEPARPPHLAGKKSTVQPTTNATPNLRTVR
jgi:DNA-binding GntR family transcriptional regulator